MAVCPVYRVGKREELVARGKLSLLKQAQAGNLPWDRNLAEILGRCLLCGRCTRNCGNQVPSHAALREARAMLKGQGGASALMERLLIDRALTSPARMQDLARAGRLAHPLLEMAVPTASGLHLRLGPLEGLDRLPAPAQRAFLNRAPRVVQGPKGAPRVGLMVGCVGNYLRPQLMDQAVALLSAGFAVVIPPDQGCCGLPALSAGLDDTAAKLAQANLAAFTQARVDRVVTTCGSCAYAMIRHWPHLAAPGQEEAAQELADKVVEISQVLAENPALIKPAVPGAGPVAVHDPCHLRQDLGVWQEPREMLERAGVDLVEMAGADQCCGGGGLLSAHDPELAAAVFQPRGQALTASGATTLATSCSGCFVQWRRGLPAERAVVHPIEVLGR